MTEEKAIERPRISVIVPSRPDEDVSACLAALARTEYPADRIEVFHVTGDHPSVQRNRCAEQARGEVLYFLDSDSRIHPPSGPGARDDTLSRLADALAGARGTAPHDGRGADLSNHLSGHRIAGGPSLTPPDDSPLQQAIGLVFGSAFGTGAIRARYRPLGAMRESNQLEIILCNLMMDREAFLALGGFNERLYPNEENELMDRFQRGGGRILYVPEAGVWRSQRRTWRAFVRQVFTYGRGRADQTRVNPKSLSPVLLIAAAFAVYVALLLPLSVLLAAWGPWLPAGARAIAAIALWGPLALHGAAVVAASVAACAASGRWSALARLPALFVVNHLGYGIGFIAGMLRRAPPPHPDADLVSWNVERLKPFGAGFAGRAG